MWLEIVHKTVVHNRSCGVRDCWVDLSKILKETTGLDLSEFEKSCAFINDCASTIPAVFGASVSANKVAYSHRWVGCITHQLNTVMKTAVESKAISGSKILKHLTLLKSIVGTMNHASPNDEMPDGFSLIEKVQTRFRKTFDVVQRFVKSSSWLAQLMASKANDFSKNYQCHLTADDR